MVLKVYARRLSGDSRFLKSDKMLLKNGNTKIWLWLGDWTYMNFCFDRKSPRLNNRQNWLFAGTMQLKPIIEDEIPETARTFNNGGEYFEPNLDLRDCVRLGANWFIIERFDKSKQIQKIANE